jgi:hypothetical protein
MFQSLEFCKNNPKIFLNYIFAPKILHLGPCIIFHNYD